MAALPVPRSLRPIVSPALASDSILTDSGRRSNTVEATAPYIYGIKAPKSGTGQLSVTTISLVSNRAGYVLSFQLYVNGVATGGENGLGFIVIDPVAYGARKRTFNLGVTIAEGDIVSLKVRQNDRATFPGCQVFTTVLIQ